MNPSDFVAAHVPGLGVIEFFSAIICIGLVVWIGIAIKRTNFLGLKVERFRHIVLKTNFPKEKAKKQWAIVEDHFYRGDENDLKIAVIEADKILEEALRESGIRGSSLGDRLKNLKSSQFPNLDQVWQAHRLRNDIVHQSTFKLKRDLAERAIKIYEEALKSFQLLD
jgi:hypothetical protein